MSEAEKVFVLDANVFIAAHRDYYAPDLCPGFWDCLRHYGPARVRSIDRVKKEILSPPELVEWRKGAGELFVSSEETSISEVFSNMMNWVLGNSQFKDKAKAEFAKAADGWLAAYAKVHNAVVVTNEQPAPEAKKTVKLPDVCKEFGVRRQDTYEMLRDLKVEFEWRGI